MSIREYLEGNEGLDGINTKKETIVPDSAVTRIGWTLIKPFENVGIQGSDITGLDAEVNKIGISIKRENVPDDVWSNPEILEDELKNSDAGKTFDRISVSRETDVMSEIQVRLYFYT